ncbi:MAG TPA: hypothetical protein VIV60_22190 [Polyangiaceae bacterium]
MMASGERLVAAAKAALPAAFVIAGAGLLLGFNEPWYPIAKWLLWHYLGVIALTLYVGVACLSLGDWVLRHVSRLSLPTHEHVAIGFVLGLTGFELGMFLLGTLQAYGRATFVLYPLALALLGVNRWRHAVRHFSRWQRVGQRLSAASVLYVVFGLGALALIYFSILTPYNVQFDARWKHMALAEDYAAHGGLRRMPEGWVFSTRPHLTSYLYVWAFLLPAGTLFHKLLLAAHLELMVFLVTTWFGIPALVRRLVPNADPRVIWVARFLFPGVMLYDSSLSAGADHFGAAIAPALALLLIRAWRKLERTYVYLAVVCLAAAAMVKETVAIMLVPIPVLAIAVRFLQLYGPAEPLVRRKLLLTVASSVGLGLTLTAPFWLKNWIWHGNPVYPNLGTWFPSRPWSNIAAYRFANEYSEAQMWSPKRDLRGLAESVQALVDFSFLPNDWSKFHGNRPVFGSLMTLLIPVLLWLRHTRRVWWLVGWIHGAIFIWYWVHHQDRYLQAIVPLMAAVAGSILLLVFRQQRVGLRAAVTLLVAVQLASAADVYFIATHAMAQSAPRRVVENLGLGHAGKFDERFTIEPRYTAIGRILPSDAHVLFHDLQSHLGTGHTGVRDAALWQYGINYSQAKHPNEIHGWLMAMGVTHIVMSATKSSGNDRLAGDLLFFDFAYRHAKLTKEVDGLLLFENPTTPRAAAFHDRAIVVSCSPNTEWALHPLSNLAQPAIGPLSLPRARPISVARSLAELGEWLKTTDYALVEADCIVPAAILAAMKKVADRPKRGVLPAYAIYLRVEP